MNIYNFIEKYEVPLSICDDLLNYYSKNIEYKSNRTDIKHTIEVQFFNDSNSKTILNFFKKLNECVNKYFKKYNLNSDVRTSIVNKIQHYKTNTGFTNLHYERNYEFYRRQLVYMLYLNTIVEGGGTEFPYQKISLKAVKGDLIIWPADFTHPHRGIISKTEEKYIVTGWFELI
tara:strand:- start:132 stop:653 length:522 start_codon:yes stop_codon:yes gene_type:complete